MIGIEDFAQVVMWTLAAGGAVAVLAAVYCLAWQPFLGAAQFAESRLEGSWAPALNEARERLWQRIGTYVGRLLGWIDRPSPPLWTSELLDRATLWLCATCTVLLILARAGLLGLVPLAVASAIVVPLLAITIVVGGAYGFHKARDARSSAGERRWAIVAMVAAACALVLFGCLASIDVTMQLLADRARRLRPDEPALPPGWLMSVKAWLPLGIYIAAEVCAITAAFAAHAGLPDVFELLRFLGSLAWWAVRAIAGLLPLIVLAVLGVVVCGLLAFLEGVVKGIAFVIGFVTTPAWGFRRIAVTYLLPEVAARMRARRGAVADAQSVANLSGAREVPG
jgi:hypothetical protein